MCLGVAIRLFTAIFLLKETHTQIVGHGKSGFCGFSRSIGIGNGRLGAGNSGLAGFGGVGSGISRTNPGINSLGTGIISRYSGPGLRSLGKLPNYNGVTSPDNLYVTSTSPISPTGVSVKASGLKIDGDLGVNGKLPFLGSVAVDGIVPSIGSSSTAYSCGSGNTGIFSNKTKTTNSCV